MSVVVVAEVGVNHDGEIDRALQLIDAAADAGADMVKFQSFRAELLAAATAAKAGYQQSLPARNQLELLHSLELRDADYRLLERHCESRGVEFFSTGFDHSSIDYLVRLGVRRLKVPSGEITNLPLLRHIGGKKLPVMLSTGMSNLGEVESAIDALESAGLMRDQITVLQCTTQYPAPLEEVNLRAMPAMGHALSVSFGYSDHTVGSAVAIAATALGATVIEKHITLNRKLPGPDHGASMEPHDFAQMVLGIRSVEVAMGDGIKKAGTRERLNMPMVRRSLVASRPIREGEAFSPDNLTAKRPGHGVSPMAWDEFIGRTARRSYGTDELIEW